MEKIDEMIQEKRVKLNRLIAKLEVLSDFKKDISAWDFLSQIQQLLFEIKGLLKELWELENYKNFQKALLSQDQELFENFEAGNLPILEFIKSQKKLLSER